MLSAQPGAVHSAMVFSSLSDRDDKKNYSAMLSRFTHEELTKAISAIREVVDKEPVLARFADGGIDLINSYLLGVIV